MSVGTPHDPAAGGSYSQLALPASLEIKLGVPLKVSSTSFSPLVLASARVESKVVKEYVLAPVCICCQRVPESHSRRLPNLTTGYGLVILQCKPKNAAGTVGGVPPSKSIAAPQPGH